MKHLAKIFLSLGRMPGLKDLPLNIIFMIVDYLAEDGAYSCMEKCAVLEELLHKPRGINYFMDFLIYEKLIFKSSEQEPFKIDFLWRLFSMKIC